MSEEEAAQVSASRGGHPVEVLSRRTETSEVLANGDGTFTWRQHLRPVWALVHGRWLAADATLHRLPDGTLTPAATTYGMVFSGGGSGPLAVLSRGSGQLALRWPTPLPVPTVDGSTATYPDVLPGVDLQIAVDVDSFSDYLIVKNPAAAANPALLDIAFGITPGGLDLVGDSSSGLRVVDQSSGVTQMSVPQPLQWPATGENADRPMTTRVSGNTLHLTPDRAMLTNPATEFPVVIDPIFPNGYQNHWSVAYKSTSCSSCASTAFYDGVTKVGSESPPEARVGHESDTGGTARALFQMNTSGLAGSRIISATFNVFDAYSYTCTAEPVELWHTGAISSSTTWNAQPSWTTKLQVKNFSHGYSSSCAGAGEDFAATALATALQAVVNSTSPNTITLGLKTTDETNTLTWKRFRVNTTNPVLQVTYNNAPTVTSRTAYRGGWSNTASDQPITCDASPSTWPMVGLAGVTLTAKVADADSQNLTTTFTVTNYGGATFATKATATAAGGMATDSLAVGTGTGKLVDGGQYTWTAKTTDGTDTSASTAACGFTADATPPANLTVTPADGYPFALGQLPARQPHTVTFAATDTHLAGFCYSVNRPLSIGSAVCSGGTYIAAQAGGTATVTLTPTRFPANQLTVVAYDTAGNSSVNDGSNTTLIETAAPVFVAEEGGVAAGDRRGDLDGDGQVDFVATTTAGTLLLYSGTGTGAVRTARQIGSGGWAGSLIAHGGDFVGPEPGMGLDGYEDLAVRLVDNNLYFYPGDGLGNVLSGTNRQLITHPGGTNWAAMTSIGAPGNVDGRLGNDLIDVEGSNLLLYSGSSIGAMATDANGVALPGTVLATGFTGWDIVIPGDVTGDGIVDVVARKHTDTTTDASYGKLYLYAGVQPSGGGYALAAPVVYAATGWNPASRVAIGGVGNAQGTVVANADGTATFRPAAGQSTPDLWATAPGGATGTGQLIFYALQPGSTGSTTVVGDGSWTTSITRIY